MGNIIRRVLGGVMTILGGAQLYFAWAGVPHDNERIWVWAFGAACLVAGLYYLLKRGRL